MNYIKQILAFYDKQSLNPLSTGEIALWHALMHVNNKTGWSEWFTVANLSLQSLSGLSRSGINKDRNVLKQNGFIDFKTKGTKATSYRVINLAMQDSNQVSSQEGNQSSSQNSVQGSNQDSTQNSSALNKQNKTKQNKRNTIAQKRKTTAKQIENDFEKLWKLYPKKKDKQAALKSYKKAVNSGTTPKEVQDGILKYRAEIKAHNVDAQYIKYGSTFFNQHSWEDDFDTEPPSIKSNLNVRETLPSWADEDSNVVQINKRSIDNATSNDELEKRLKNLNR
ncbi:hypothetical protein ACQW5G_01275 [Fructilactobacillus sp. Tb1]|uniref:hypothetical protein n=1 Tax=Fructilactobacillus sp. Tb1 TaxID=3422304 RepID=UPI003D27426B